jgi:tetratricopeptide (TPR) repeat protein
VKEGRLAGHAYDVIRVIEGRQISTEKNYSCPEEARKSSSTAYYLFRGNRLKEALTHYKRAIDECPENASLWIQYGHTFMMLRDFDQAKIFMSEGLKRDPWNRSGHLFLSDLYRSVGELELAYKHTALEVVSDPSYEFGWGNSSRNWRTQAGETGDESSIGDLWFDETVREIHKFICLQVLI